MGHGKQEQRHFVSVLAAFSSGKSSTVAIQKWKSGCARVLVAAQPTVECDGYQPREKLRTRLIEMSRSD